MTANYPASILPPNATAVERAIDRASAAALERLPVYLIRWVKDPTVARWRCCRGWRGNIRLIRNINWSEQKKRDAIKRAHYIHRHRGTVAAVRHARWTVLSGRILLNGSIRTRKDPYTFRLNVYQNDLPVTEYDQQDLKLAVLRAGICAAGFPFMYLADFRNLVCGRLHVRHGENHAALCPVAGGFIPLRAESGPGDAETVTVTILPEYAEDKTFTVTTSDQTIATARIVNGDILVTGMKRGTCSITVTTTNGVSAVISIKWSR